VFYATPALAVCSMLIPALLLVAGCTTNSRPTQEQNSNVTDQAEAGDRDSPVEPAPWQGITRLDAHAGSLADLEWKTDGELDGVSELDFSHARGDVGKLEQWTSLPNLTTLRLMGMDLNDADLVHVGRAAKLQELDLRLNPITDQDLQHLSGLTQLRRLDLSYTNIGDEGLESIAPLRGLQSLSLAHTLVTDAGLEALLDFPALKHLDVTDTRVTPTGIQGLGQARPEVKLLLDSATDVH